MKGNGYYVNEYNVIYVQGSVNGKFIRKSTKMKATKANITYVKKNANAILEELAGKPKRSESFEEFGLSVLSSTSRSRNTATQKEVISKFERLIVPQFKRYDMCDIRTMDIEKWQVALLKDYSTSTVKSCRHILSNIFKKAVANDLIIKNPCDYADKIKASYSKKIPYTVEEAKAMMANSDGFMKLYLNLAFTTGLRTGEMLGLKWDDIDLEHGCIVLQRSVTKGVISSSNATKNHARIVYILPHIAEMLLEYKLTAQSEWIFTPEGSSKPFYDSKPILKKHFKPLLKKLKIEDRTLYATRHTFYSISSMANIDPLFLQRMGGHKEGSDVTEKHYISRELNDASAAYARESLKPLENIFGSTK